ncbi:MAG: hypothetical protein ACRD22_06445 [Terriglobia bacterium]
MTMIPGFIERRKAGYELVGAGADKNLIKCSLAHEPLHDKEQILIYLRRGKAWAARPEVNYDLLSDKPVFIPGGVVFYCDDQWSWPNLLIYYLEKYNYPPQEEFLVHIRNRNYSPPEGVQGDVRRENEEETGKDDHGGEAK